MSIYSTVAKFDKLRSIAASSTSGSYVALGAAYTENPVTFKFTNTMNGDALISDDGVNDKIIVPAGSYVVYDVRSNGPYNEDFVFPVGTQISVKQGPTTPTEGTLYLETIIATREYV